jgi:proteasome lid subunit RPN8/RPN11
LLKLAADLRELILAEGAKSYPYECCGLILGEDKGPDRLGRSALIVNNSREGEDRRRRFVIEPEDFLKAEMEAQRRGEDVIGVYHSHPDHPAAPSQYDLDHALPYYSYVIVSVSRGVPGELTSWTLKADRSGFLSEELGSGEPGA